MEDYESYAGPDRPGENGYFGFDFDAYEGDLAARWSINASDLAATLHQIADHLASQIREVA